MTNVLEVEGLGVRFGNQIVLEKLSFAVSEGETLAILGPNGAGKTALFEALIGAIPFEGRVRWAGKAMIGY